MAAITFSQSGQRSVRKFEARAVLNGFFTGAVTTTSRWDFVAPCSGRIVAINMHAAGAGSGTGNTEINVLKNGASIFSGTDRFSIASADTGYLDAVYPTDAGESVRAGDQLSVQVTAIPTTTGHANIAFTVVIG